MIEVFADLSCPFTHVGLRRLVTRRAEVGSDVRFRIKAWPLEWVNGAPLAPDVVATEITALQSQVAPELFRGFNPATFPTTTVPALALTSLAYSRDVAVGEAVGLALRDALFERGLDVVDPEVLQGIAAAHGLDATLADPEAVRSEYEEGKARGVTGSPFFLVGEVGFLCPSLEITKVDGHFVINTDVAALDDFADRVFGGRG